MSQKCNASVDLLVRAEQNFVIEFKVNENVIFQSVGKFDSRLDFAHIPVIHSNSTAEKILDNSSFSICENVGSHFRSFESTVEKYKCFCVVYTLRGPCCIAFRLDRLLKL